MNNDRMAPDAPLTQLENHARQHGAQRRIDSIDQPARPLGAKRAALQQRRKRHTGASLRKSSATGPQGLCTLTSRDEAVSFILHTTPAGLLIDRTQTQLTGARLTQSMVFVDQASFDRWCGAEPLRFGDAVLFGQLVRAGHGAFSEHS